MMIWIFPYGAIQFITFEHDGTFTTTKLSFWSVHRLMAGSVAGLTAVISTYPLHMVRVHRTLQVKEEHTYTGISHAFKIVWAKESDYLVFYRGLIPAVLGMVLSIGMYLVGWLLFSFWYLSCAPYILGRISDNSKSPTYKPSICKLSKMWVCVHMSNHVSSWVWRALSHVCIFYKWLWSRVHHCVAL